MRQRTQKPTKPISSVKAKRRAQRLREKQEEYIQVARGRFEDVIFESEIDHIELKKLLDYLRDKAKSDLSEDSKVAAVPQFERMESELKNLLSLRFLYLSTLAAGLGPYVDQIMKNRIDYLYPASKQEKTK